MSIDIKSTGGGPGQNAPIDRTGSQGGRPASKSAPAAPATGGPDKVTFTGDAERLAKLDEAIQSTSGVDSNRVAEIRKAIASGTFKVDSEQIASKLIDLERDLNR